MTDAISSEPSVHTPPGLGANRAPVRPDTGVKAKIKQFILDHIEVFVAPLRDFAPILILKKKNLALVTRYDEVKEVFLADDAFGVPYAPKLNLLTGGVPFLLGMEDSQAYRDSLKAWQDVFRLNPAAQAADVTTRLIPATEAAAERIVAASHGRVDTIELASQVSLEVFLDYFGVPAPADGDIALWSERLFEWLFRVGKPEPQMDSEAAAYSKALLAHVERVIAARKASGEKKDDILGRSLQNQAESKPGFSDTEIRSMLAGFIIAGPPQPPVVLPKVMEQLLRRPKILAEAQDAARRNDDETLGKYVFEAMRFDPLAPFLQRIAKRQHVLGDGTFHMKTIERGTQVAFFVASAMMDDRRVSSPKSFDPNRPRHHYFLFGHGLHRCFGLHINEKLLPLILKPLLQRKGLRRASGPEGHLRKRLIYPEKLDVCFDDEPVVHQ
jgi:cytochrome P450